MDVADVEGLRTRIGNSIGRDSVLITSDDRQRHFDGLSFIAFYAGTLFLAFVTAAGKRLWQRATQQAEKTAENAVDSLWQEAARKLSSASDKMEEASDAKQVQRIKDTDDALQQLASELSGAYMSDFIEAGEEAVKNHLERDHFPGAKATHIAHAVALEVKARMGGEHS